MKTCEDCEGHGTLLDCPNPGFWSPCYERPCPTCLGSGSDLDKQEVLEHLLNEHLITTDEALILADYPIDVIERTWLDKLKAGLRATLAASAIAYALWFTPAAAAAVKPRTCSQLAAQVAGRGVTDRYEVDVIMHDRGCRKPYDVWIRMTERCGARSHELWSHRVPDRDRRRNLKAEGCKRYEDGSWGSTRPQDTVVTV
jgi:hypothetical protein